MSQNRRELEDGSGKTVLEDGSVVGRFKVEYLASGGMSHVYKGVAHGETFVLKEVSAGNTKEVPALISEKNLLERLNHPGVVAYHSFFNENGYYYLVLEFVKGEPLSECFKPDKQPTPEAVAEWGVQLCEIFDYLHVQNPPVIYRDLKAENILLTWDGKIKLIDFGIARLHKGERKKDTELMGSPATASPEHYGGAETDARSDIFTLGATLYELLSGGRRKKLGAFQFAPITEFNPAVSPELEKVLVKATQFKPMDRYQSAVEMRDALLKVLGRKIPPRKVRSRRAGDRGGKSRWLLVSLFLLLIGGAIGFFGYKEYQKTQSPFYKGPVPSQGTYEESLQADIFSAGDVDGRAAVMLGEDIGLFAVTGWKEGTPEMRAKKLAQRLNAMYHQACLPCGGTGLEPYDIKIGRHKDSGEVVVFYAHMHGPEIHWGPELLATVDMNQAEALGVTPRFVAGYWRDLVRDTVNLSRGFDVQESVLGPELSRALLEARDQLRNQTDQLKNLRSVVKEVTGKESLRMRDIFLEVPDRKPKADNFPPVEGYEPLTI